jgi:hypothetical protein
MVLDENEKGDDLNLSTKSSCSSGSESFDSIRNLNSETTASQNSNNFDAELTIMQDKIKVSHLCFSKFSQRLNLKLIKRAWHVKCKFVLKTPYTI